MSMSLEERRAERRRRRQMEEEASSVATVNGEDDFERKRRERREARLRASGDTDYSSTNDYSSRRNRRRGTEDENSEETPVVNEEPASSSLRDTSEEDAAEERRRRQREEEEEEERRQAEREAEEERERQAALEEERQREREEEERRQEEERIRQEEEEERLRQADQADDESVSTGSSDDGSFKQHRGENKLFIDEDNQSAERSTNNGKHGVLSSTLDIHVIQSVPKVSERKDRIEQSVLHEKSSSLDSGTSLEVNNNKIKDKLNKFEHLRDESDVKKSKDKGLILPIVEKDGFKGKLKKFETEIKTQDSTTNKNQNKSGPNTKTVILTPQTHKLSEKLHQFEQAAKSQSASRPSARNVQRTETRDTPKRNVLDRWKSVDKPPQEQAAIKSPTERKEVLTKRLSGNTEFIAHKYLEKASKSIDETSSPKTPTSATHKLTFTQSFDHRLSSPPAENQSEFSYRNHNQSRSKVTSRWSQDEGKGITQDARSSRSQYSTSSVERNGRDSSFDSGTPHSRGSSIDESSGSARKSVCQQQEEEEAERERQRQEEEQTASEQAARMAAEEGQKKRGKRKGLGGLTPEKKKKLKQIIMQKAAEDLKKEALAKAEEKEKFINERVGPFNTEGLGEAELRKLIKGLHEKLAQIHSESYDIEFKLNKQEKEIVDLNMKISDSRGKFAKPVLRKVNKTEQKFKALAKKQEAKDDFREALKSAHDDDEPAE